MQKTDELIHSFLSPTFLYRLKNIQFKNELLIKALGLKPSMREQVKIIDATGGLGQDSCLMASLGFKVTLIERSATVYQLLKNAIETARESLPFITQITLLHADSITYLATLHESEAPDMIYLDPMFPPSKKTALNKKSMRLLHDLVGEDLDADQLLNVALTCAKQRVVVKRPRLAESLANVNPKFSLMGKSNRFDVYTR